MYDVIIVGSGPAGISSAWPLVKAKKKVIMIDVGFTHSNNSNSVNKALFRSSSPKIASPEFSFVFNRFKELNKIKTSNGELWLSVPVESKGHLDKNVSDILIIQDKWVTKHLKSIELNYKKAPFFHDYFPKLQSILINESKSSLGLLNLKLLESYRKFFI